MVVPELQACREGRADLPVGERDALALRSGERAAAIYSLLRTAALHGADSQEYVTDVLNQLAVPRTAASIDTLLPDAWMAARAAFAGPEAKVA